MKSFKLNKILYSPQIGIGDLVFSIPLLHSLRKAYPDYEITVPIISSEQELASRSLAPLFRNLLSFHYFKIDKALDIKRKQIYRRDDFIGKFSAEFEKRSRFERKVLEFYLEGEHFSMAILPRRFKIDSINCPNQINLNDLPYVEKSHMVERNLRFADYLNIEKVMSFELSLDLSKGIINNLGESVDLPKKFVTLILCAGRPAKKWSLEGNKSVCKFIKRKGYVPVLIGSPQEYEEAKKIEDQEVINLVQKDGFFADLYNSAKLLKFSTAAVGGDTGLTHLADAVKTRVIGLYGPNRPSKSAPYHNQDLVISTNGSTKKVKNISSNQVISKLENLLK